MKIIANQGHDSYLIEVGPEEHWIFNADENTVVKGFPKDSILAHGGGYWEEWKPGVLDAGILQAMNGAHVEVTPMKFKRATT